MTSRILRERDGMTFRLRVSSPINYDITPALNEAWKLAKDTDLYVMIDAPSGRITLDSRSNVARLADQWHKHQRGGQVSMEYFGYNYEHAAQQNKMRRAAKLQRAPQFSARNRSDYERDRQKLTNRINIVNLAERWARHAQNEQAALDNPRTTDDVLFRALYLADASGVFATYKAATLTLLKSNWKVSPAIIAKLDNVM